jgi:hypothetical protein
MDKAQWAINLLKDDTFQEVLENLRGNELNKIINSTYGELELREEAYTRMKVLESIETHLESMAAQKMMDEKRIKIL